MKPTRLERYAFGPDRTKDKTERDPVGTVGRARATLYRASKTETVPEWFDGTLEQYRSEVESAVFAEHGAVEVPAEHSDIAALSADVILFSGEAFEPVAKNRFKKDVLRAGEFVHRSTGDKIPMSRERVSNAVTATNRFLKEHKVPFPMRHTSEPDRNLGFWRSFEFTDAGEAFGIVDVERATDLERIGSTITDVSVQLEGPVFLQDGTKLDEVFTHVCATNYPVINNQKNFEPVALSLDAHGYSVYVQSLSTDEETDSVKLDELKKLLKLSADATEADVEKALAKIESDKNAALKLAADAEKSKTSLEAKVETLTSENTHLAGRLTKVEAKAIDDELNLALEAGTVSTKNGPRARAALMSRATVKLSLSADGEEKDYDLAEFVRDWIKDSTPVGKLARSKSLSADEESAKKAEIMAERRMDAAAWEANHQGEKVTWFDSSATEGAGMQNYKRPDPKPVRERLGIA